MGAADIVPGVSGGTIALISGIYEEFVNSLKSFSSVIPVLKNKGFKAAWKHLNGEFLSFLFFGIALSFISLVQGIKYALEHFPVLVWSFFFGLVLASCYYVAKQVEKWNMESILGLILGAAGIYLITKLGPAETSAELWFVFLSGMIAICAMILPGISGAFILVLLGKYKFIIESISELKMDVILVFSIGCGVGLLSFSHLLSFMLKKYHHLTIALLSGFMIGSLNKIWPWKETLKWGTDRHGEKIPVLEENILPGLNQLWIPLLFGLIGFTLIVLLEKWAAQKETS